MARVLGELYSCGRPGGAEQLCSGHCGHLDGEPGDGRSPSISPLCQNLISNKNKLTFQLTFYLIEHLGFIPV